VRQILDSYIERHLAARSEGFTGNDILDALMHVRDPDTGEGLSHEALVDETKTLFAAGMDTTATALAWTLYLLASHPEAAARWYEEVDRVVGSSAIEWSHLEKLQWLEQVVNESMRVYPPVYLVPRECIEDDEWDGRKIPRGSLMLISVFGLHRSESLWPQAEAFRPERFDPDRDWPKNAFMPFGMGKHICIGMSFAMTEMKVILAMIAQRYRLEYAESETVREVARITLTPSREVRVRLTPRG
jgi:cytochrome P450